MFHRKIAAAAVTVFLVAFCFGLLECGTARADRSRRPAGTDVLVVPKPADLKKGDWQTLGNNPYRGAYTHDYLEKNKKAVRLLLKAKPDFRLKDVGVSGTIEAVRAADGREFLVMSGCVPHNCGGNLTVIAYNPSQGRAYLLSENFSPGNLGLFGKPDPLVTNLLVYSYLNWGKTL